MNEEYKRETYVLLSHRVIRVLAIVCMIGFILVAAAIGGFFLLQWAGQYATRTVFAGSDVEVSG